MSSGTLTFTATPVAFNGDGDVIRPKPVVAGQLQAIFAARPASSSSSSSSSSAAAPQSSLGVSAAAIAAKMMSADIVSANGDYRNRVRCVSNSWSRCLCLLVVSALLCRVVALWVCPRRVIVERLTVSVVASCWRGELSLSVCTDACERGL